MSISPATKYLLKSLIPYTDANLRLAYRPASFFYELEKQSKIKERTLRSAYYRAIKKQLIVLDENGQPTLTDKGKLSVKRYTPQKLGKGAYLIVSFDFPVEQRVKRDRFRKLLKELSFTMIQQSLWMTRFDHRELLHCEIQDQNIANQVIIYEAIRLK